jgi:putative Holliday junction resolvase
MMHPPVRPDLTAVRTRTDPSMSIIVGLDVGEARVGVAVSDEERKIAFPMGVIHRLEGSFGFRQLERVLGDREVGLFVLGMPYRTDGSASAQGERISEYGRELGAYFGVEVVYRDERYTSEMAHEILSEGGVKPADHKKHVDKIAAQLILQDFLDSGNPDPD